MPLPLTSGALIGPARVVAKAGRSDLRSADLTVFPFLKKLAEY